MLKEIFDFVLGIATDWTLDRVFILFVGMFIGALGLLKVGQWMDWLASPFVLKGLRRQNDALEREIKTLNDRLQIAAGDHREEQGKSNTYLTMMESQQDQTKVDRRQFDERVEILTSQKAGLAAEVEKWHAEADKSAGLLAEQGALVSRLKTEGRKLLARRNPEQLECDRLCDGQGRGPGMGRQESAWFQTQVAGQAHE